MRFATAVRRRWASVSDDGRIVFAALFTIAVGIWIDTRALWFCQPLVDLGAWAVLLWILTRVHADERKQLVLCVLIGALGECFLGFVWGLYEYRLGNLPLFIPAGHALVYAAGKRLKHLAPRWLPAVLASLLGCATVLGAWSRWDTQSLLWYPLFLSYLWWSRDRSLYATMFPLALAVESYGTWLGGWSYHVHDPWFGLSTITRPPVWTGTFYCTLDALVLMTSRAPWSARLVHQPWLQGPRLVARLAWAWSQPAPAKAESRTAET